MINNKNLITLINTLKKHKISIGSVESFTGGLFAATLTSVSGVSEVFRGSIVSYNEDIKEKVVGVKKSTIKKYTVVSSAVAEDMATEGAKVLGTDLTVSFTGNAGPSVCEGDKEVGLFYISIYFQSIVYTVEKRLNLDRNELREEAVNIAIKIILEILEKNNFLPHLF